MSNAANKWTPSQLYAINCQDRDLLLSAGAGSGKTATLTERVCRLVTDEDAGIDISRMLIVTFTRAAAEELRTRVRSKLEEKLKESPSSAFLSRQIVSLDSADISTISGFFLKAIRPYYSALGLPPAFSVADEVEMKVMKDRIMNDVLDDFFDGGSDGFTSLCDAISSAKNESSVNDSILAIADRLSSKGFSPSKLAEWAAGLDEAAEGDFLASPHGKIIRDLTASFAKRYLGVFTVMAERIAKDAVTAEKYGASAAEHTDFLMRLLSAAKDGTYADIKYLLSSFSP